MLLRCHAYIHTNKLDFGYVREEMLCIICGWGPTCFDYVVDLTLFTHTHKLPSLEEICYPNHAPQFQLPKTQTQKSNPLKSKGMGHTFIKACPLVSLFLCAFCYLVCDMFPIAIGLKVLMTHKPLHLETSMHVFWNGLLLELSGK
jgi:hypothetical protein